jgi:PAS domain S-box-containing protein
MADNTPPHPESGRSTRGILLTRFFPDRWPRWRGYVLGVALAAAAVLIRIGLSETFGDRLSLILFVLPILISAYLGGLGPGLAATLTAAAGVNFFLIPPVCTFTFHKVADFSQWLMLIVTGAAISVVTEALHRSRQHEESSLLLQAVTLASIGDAVITTDPQGRITFLNSEAERLTGWPYEEALGLPLAVVFRIINEQTRETLANPVDAVLASGKTMGLANHTVLLTRDGRECPIADSGAPIRDDRGVVLGAVLVFRDCTEPHRAEQALRENREDLNRAQAVAHTGSWRLNVQKNELTWSEETHRIFGIPPDTPMTYETFLGAVYPEDREYVDARWKAALQGEPYDLEHRIVVDGTLKWLRERAELEFDREGQILGGFGTVQDITERKQAEAALRASEEHYRSLFDNMLNGFAYCQMLYEDQRPVDFVYLNVNQAFTDLTGLENVTGKKVSEVIPGLQAANPQVFEVYNQVATTGVPGRFETYIATLDMWFSVSVYSPQPGHFVAIFDVINERKQAEAALKESEDRLRLFIEYAPVSLAMFDRQMRYLKVSRGWLMDYGLGDRNILGLSHYEVFPKMPDRWRDANRRALAGDVVRNDDDCFERADGSLRYLRWEVRPWYGKDVGVGGVVIFTEDITQRRQAEKALRQSEALYHLLFDTMGQGVVFQDAGGKIIKMNPAAERILGHSQADLLKETSASLEPQTMRPDGSPFPATEHPSMVALRTGQEVHNTVMGFFNPQDESYRWININAVPLAREPGARPYQAYTVFEDITERLKAEETLATSRSKLEAALASMTDAVFISDAQGRFIDCNEAFATFHKFKNKEECATTLAEFPAFLEIFLPGGEPAPLEQWAVPRALRGETAANAEYTLRRKDTGATWVGSYSFAPIRDHDGGIIGSVVAARDITEEKRAAEALAKSLAEKTALLKEVHHRVKNNLQIVASLLSLQASRTPHPEVIKVLDDTRQRVHSMALLHEALYRSDNLARINFAAYVEALCRHLRRAAGPVATRVAVDTRIIPLGLPLEQSLPCGLIINELVSNALKHGFPGDRNGRVTVTLDSAPDNQIVLNVTDDGIGLPPDINLAATPTLGLQLVFGLASQLGGRMTMTPPEGRGAAFQVTFPMPEDTLAKDNL